MLHIIRVGICKICCTKIITALSKEHDNVRFNKPVSIITCPICANQIDMLEQKIPEWKDYNEL